MRRNTQDVPGCHLLLKSPYFTTLLGTIGHKWAHRETLDVLLRIRGFQVQLLMGAPIKSRGFRDLPPPALSPLNYSERFDRGRFAFLRARTGHPRCCHGT
jgi:hypothetical protein